MNQEQKVPSLKNCQRLFDLEITKQLTKTKIEFSESEKVWIHLLQKPVGNILHYQDWKIGYRPDLNLDYGWIKFGGHKNKFTRYQSSGICDEYFPALDLSELGWLFKMYGINFYSGYIKDQSAFCRALIKEENLDIPCHYADTEPNARAKMLIKLKEEGVI